MKENKQPSDFRNYLLQRFNDYEVPIQMSAEDVRELIARFHGDWIKDKGG